MMRALRDSTVAFAKIRSALARFVLTLVIIAGSAAALTFANPESRSSASTPTNQNLDGCWQLDSQNEAFSIGSGASTTVSGFLIDTITTDLNSESCDVDEPLGSLSGFVSKGSGYLTSGETGFVITGVAGTTMTGYVYYSGESSAPTSAPSYAECEAEHEANPSTGPNCLEFTATNVAPPNPSFTLKGEIILQCDSGGSSCLANGEPFEGLKVNVAGDNGTASDTTNDDGIWSVKLPSGSYTITPTDPNMTFTPLNAEVHLDSDTTAKKFSACASAQTADSPQALSRRPESKARGLIYSLVGINCTTSEFSAVYNTKATPILKLTWKSSVYQCGSTKKFVHQESTDVPIPYSDVRRKDDANGVTVWLKIDSPKGNPRYDPILKMTVNPGYASGSVTLNGLGVGEDTFGEGTSIKTCTPISAQMTLAPGTGL